ncbi:MAG: FGGY family carbohydrate kinase [Dehalococcoidia bacterium]
MTSILSPSFPVALSIDLGTSAVKALLVDPRGQVRAQSSRPTPIITPRQVAPLGREMRPHQVLRAVQQAARAVLLQWPSAQVAVVALTSMRQGIALLDRDGREVYLGPNIDLRAVFEGGALDEAYGDIIYRTTGHLPSLFFPWSRLLWLRKHHPRAYERGATLLTVADWLAYHLTGIMGVEVALAGEAGLLDIGERRWATALARTLGLRDDWFPPLAQASAVRGGLNKEGASLLGLPEGTPVVVAGPDTQCALLAAGACQAWQLGVVLGWSTAVQLLTPSPRFGIVPRTWVGTFPDGVLWTAEANAGDGGRALQWVVETLYGKGAQAWVRLARDVERVEAGSDGVRAFLGPDALDLSHPGVRLGGWLLPVPLSFSPLGRGHLARATLENLAFAVRACVELLEEVAGDKVKGVHLAGGLLRLPSLAPILASVLGKVVEVAPHPSASALGAALVALRNLGVSQEPLPLDTCVPRPEWVMLYADLYQAWRKGEQGLGAIGLG